MQVSQARTCVRAHCMKGFVDNIFIIYALGRHGLEIRRQFY